MSLKDVVLTVAGVITSLGGGGVIVWALSSYLGKIWANKVLADHKLKLDKELESLKNEHRTEIEKYKTELEKARNDYNRYSSKKFEIIEETWSAMFKILKELKVYNFNEGNYTKFLQNTLDVISEYLVLIRKNSLYFNDGLCKLLNDYVSLSSKVVSDASEKIKKLGNFDDNEKVSKIFQEVYNTATERDKLLDDIKKQFRIELGVD
jgi:hypothetical protein